MADSIVTNAWVKLECPRCRAVSSVPATLKGHYVACPGCNMRAMVAQNAQAAEAPSGIEPHTILPAPAGAAAVGGAPPGPPRPMTAQPITAYPGTAQPGGHAAPQGGSASAGAASAPRGPARPGAAGGSAQQRSGPAGARPATGAAQQGPPQPPVAPRPPNHPFGEAPLAPPLGAGPAPPVGLPAGPGYGSPPGNAAAGGNGPAGWTAQPGQNVAPRMPGGGPPMVPALSPGAGWAGGVHRPAPGAFGGVAIPEAGSPLAGGGAPGAPGQRKVARFIAADAAQSALALAPDGQLPTLTLVDTAKVEKDPNEGSSINPLFLIIGGAISVCLSVVLLFADLGGEGSDPGEDRVRQQLELYYKGQREPLAAYQSRLRQAQQAYSRGDRKTANQNYRKVLELLRSEGANRFGGLTGTPSGDKRLEELLSRMLSQDYSPEAPEEQ